MIQISFVRIYLGFAASDSSSDAAWDTGMAAACWLDGGRS